MRKKRITQEARAIADAHIRARMDDKFDDLPVSDNDEFKYNIFRGKTYSKVLEEIELKYSTNTSVLTARMFKHCTDSYKRAVYKGFSELIEKLNK